MNREKLYGLFAESELFELVVGEISDDSWLVSSISGAGLEVRPTRHTVEIIGTVSTKYPELINMFVYQQMAEICRKGGCCLGALSPLPERASKITISREVPIKSFQSYCDLDVELCSVDMVISTVIKYLGKVARDVQFEEVDISMFFDLDLDAFDLDRWVQRKYIEFNSWEDIIEHSRLELEGEHEDAFEAIEKTMRACQEFEEKNPKLILPEVISHLIIFVQETFSKIQKNNLYIN